MKLFKPALTLFLAAAAISSCASKEVNQRLDEKLARQDSVRTRKDLDAKASSLVANAPGLSEEQRQRMDALKAQLQSKLSQLNKDSLELRALLVKDVLAGSKTQEINDVKTRLRKNSQARIDAIFSAVNNANDVLGRNQLIEEAMDMQSMEDLSDF